MYILNEHITDVKAHIEKLESQLDQDFKEGIDSGKFLKTEISNTKEYLQELEEVRYKAEVYDEFKNLVSQKREQAIGYQVEYAEFNWNDMSPQVHSHIGALDYASKVMSEASTNVLIKKSKKEWNK